MAAGHARGTLARHRAQCERHDRDLLQALRRKAPDLHFRQQRMAQFLDIPDRATTTRTVDQTHQRQPQIAGHDFGKNHFVADCAIIGTTAHGEIVPHHDNRALLNACATNDHVGRRHIEQLALSIVLARPRKPANFAKALRIHQLIDALAHRQFAAVMLPANLLLAAHPQRESLAAGKFLEFRRPTHFDAISQKRNMEFRRSELRGPEV